MIKFFRRIRQRLLSQNRFSKYLLYAIGEIVLVVIGILIALQVNNNNIQKKDRIVEIKILKEIKSNLVRSVAIFEQTILTEEDYLNSNLLIEESLDHKKPYSNELEKAFGDYFWTVTTNPITSGYEFLKSKGLEIVTNDSLRTKISYLYDTEFSIVKQENEVWSNNLQQSVSYPYHVTLFRSNTNEDETTFGAIPFSYESLFVDNKFKSINSEIIINRRWNISSLKAVIDKMKALILKIDLETEFLTNNL